MNIKTNNVKYRGVQVEGKNAQQLIVQERFQQWFDNNELRFRFKHIQIIFARYSSNPRVIRTAFLECLMASQDGESEYTRQILLRWNAVGVLIILIDKESGAKYALLVSQERIAPGLANSLEIVAGMCEPGENDEDVAQREVFEETGETVNTLIKLCNPTDMTTGMVYEKMSIYVAEQFLTLDQIQSKNGNIHGLEAENEHTNLVVMPLKDIINAHVDMKTKLACALYMLNQQ